MTTKHFCFALTAFFLLTCVAVSAQPDGPRRPVAPKTEELQVNSIAELFDLVARAKQDSSLTISREWIQKEYDRLVRELDATYHPAAKPAEPVRQSDKAVSDSRPAEYGWATREG